MDKSYITSIIDILLISAILVISSSFRVTHKLAENRKEELLTSASASFNEELTKVYKYLQYSLIINVIVLYFMSWLFWPLEFLFLFLLIYKVIYQINSVYGEHSARFNTTI